MGDDRSVRAGAGLLGLLLFVTYAYFVAPPSWNENSRFDLTRSLVERRSLDIEPYHHNTADKAFHDGLHYSDKAPGASFLAVPAYALFHGYLWLVGGDRPGSAPREAAAGSPPPPRAALNPEADPDYLVNAAFRRALYVCNLFTNALAGAALGALFLLHLVRRLGAAPRRALVAALALGLGSLVLPYATMFYGHVLAATFLFGTFFLVGGPDAPPPRRLIAAGVLAGAAIMTELPTAPIAAALLIHAAPRVRLRGVAWMAAGLAGPVLLLVAYQAAAFGSGLRPGYALVTRPEFAEGMSKGLLGIGWPRLTVLYEQIFGRARGLVYLGPVLALAFVGLARMAWRREARGVGLLAGAVVAYFLLMNAGYYMWYGGSALGPRHLIPALPFLCLGLAAVPTGLWPLVGLTLAVSVANHLAGTAVQPTAPFVEDVLRDHVHRHILAGELATGSGATNLGLLMGLPGLWSLAPLALVWALGLRLLLAHLPRGPSAIIIPPSSPGEDRPADLSASR